MRLLPVDLLEPGMVLAETVYSAKKSVLLVAGTLLTGELINSLREKNILIANVNDENTIDLDPEDVLVNRVHSKALQVLGHFLPADVVCEQLGEAKERYRKAAQVLSEVVKNRQVANLYLDLRAADDNTLDHSVTVCVLSLIMGMGLKMEGQRLRLLGISALVHDIGKKSVPQEILNKREDLTSAEAKKFREHAKKGYHILREREFDAAVARVALYHHERWDGSGYNKLKGEEIDLASRIVAIADTYDDLTRGLTYKHKYLPHEALEFLYGAGHFYFDARAVKAFTGNICAYPLGSIVRLCSGETGIVVNVEKTMAPRPIVKIFYDRDNTRLDYPKQVDLSEEKTTFITKIL